MLMNLNDILELCCEYIVYCERLGRSYREMSVAFSGSKWRWQHSNMVTLQWGLVTGFPVTEGTFLEAPCKAFWFARAYHQGNLHVGNSGFSIFLYFFHVSVFTCCQRHHINKLTSATQPAFPGQALIGMRVKEQACEGSVYWYDKTYFILKV